VESRSERESRRSGKSRRSGGEKKLRRKKSSSSGGGGGGGGFFQIFRSRRPRKKDVTELGEKDKESSSSKRRGKRCGVM
jgi:hypothetical protein